MTEKFTLNADVVDSSEINPSGMQDRNDYHEKEAWIIKNGSSHVLNDFLEFTDYLVPVNRRTRFSITEDYYSALNSL